MPLMPRTVVSAATEPVKEALSLADPLGVISVYLSARDAAIPGNTAVRGLEVELGRVGRLIDTSWTTGPGPAHAALAAIEQHVRGAILSGGARDLALFAALGLGQVVVIEPSGTVPTRATLGRRADVRPLCVALDEAHPAGVALVSAEGVRVLEWAPGSLTDVWSETLPELEEPDLVGPAHAHPRGQPGSAPGPRVAQQRDLFETRMRGELEKLLVGAGRKIAELAAEHDWRELALAGDERLTSALARGLPSGAPVEIAPVPRLEQWRSDGELAPLVAPAVAAGAGATTDEPRDGGCWTPSAAAERRACARRSPRSPRDASTRSSSPPTVRSSAAPRYPARSPLRARSRPAPARRSSSRTRCWPTR